MLTQFSSLISHEHVPPPYNMRPLNVHNCLSTTFITFSTFSTLFLCYLITIAMSLCEVRMTFDAQLAAAHVSSNSTPPAASSNSSSFSSRYLPLASSISFDSVSILFELRALLTASQDRARAPTAPPFAAALQSCRPSCRRCSCYSPPARLPRRSSSQCTTLRPPPRCPLTSCRACIALSWRFVPNRKFLQAWAKCSRASCNSRP